MRTPSLVRASLAALLLAAGCDESFAPIESSDLQFSIWGYLDVSADTQWIRVMDMRPLLVTEPGPLGATVTLENTATGRKLVLHDSVFNFGANPEAGIEGRYVHNYWTPEPIEPGATYRFTAQHSGQQPVTATVQLPADYDITVLIKQAWVGGYDQLQLTAPKHVAFVTSTTWTYDECGSQSTRLVWPNPAPPTSGAYFVPVIRAGSPSSICGTPLTERRELWVAASESVWPTAADFNVRLGSGLPASPTISNSLGFLGGVLTRRVPYETCAYASRTGAPNYCALHYDSAKATLRGQVWDRRCDWAVPRANVQLREADPVAPVPARIRSMQTARAGEFEFRGIDAGRWILTVSRDEVPDPDVLEYETYTATLTLSSGQQLAHNLNLVRTVLCGAQP